VFRLIAQANREGWHGELVTATCEYVPGNLELQQFCSAHPDVAPL